MPNSERLEALLKSDTVTGLDFIYVHEDRQTLDIYFLKDPGVKKPLFTNFNDISHVGIFRTTCEGKSAGVALNKILWVEIDDNEHEVIPAVHPNVLRVVTKTPLDLSRYTLHIDDTRLDTSFNDVEFIVTAERLEALFKSKTVTGLDFIYVHENQQTLDVFFHKHPGKKKPKFTNFNDISRIYILKKDGDKKSAGVTIKKVAWVEIDDNGQEIIPAVHPNVLRIYTETPGDFSRYILHIDDPRLDAFFNDIEFTFKANCPSDLDCRKKVATESDIEWKDFPVDYQARDFWSFRQALLDFASQRYPDWQDRLEADAGMMLVEVMSALADEMAYYQDRVGREAYLETASQRRSLRGHTRLVDYNIHDGLGASSWLDVTVKDGETLEIPAGARVYDQDGAVAYEVGRGLPEVLAEKKYKVDARCNCFDPYWWDEDDKVIPAGQTQLCIQGHHTADLEFSDRPADASPGRWMLLQEKPSHPAQLMRAWMVRVIEIEDDNDPVFNKDITRLEWEPGQALPFSLNLTGLSIRGNLVPITAGETYKTLFTIRDSVTGTGEKADPRYHLPKALEREGILNKKPDTQAAPCSISYRFSLPYSDEKNLIWLGSASQLWQPADYLRQSEKDKLDWMEQEARASRPEIFLQEVTRNGSEWKGKPEWEWKWRRTLVGTDSSQSTDTHFVLEDGYWSRVAGYRRSGVPEEIIHEDYAQSHGATIRFGDGEFGKVPTPGTVFEVTYRLGNGRADDVLRDTLGIFVTNSECKECSKQPDTGKCKILCSQNTAFNQSIEAVSNPFDIKGNLDAEVAEKIRQFAPQEFRAVTYRAVRPEDYAEAVERLDDWVQRAGGTFRYTGSWLTAFVTPDPKGGVQVDPVLQARIQRQLDRFRQAGREAYVMNPQYATLDLIITICVETSSYCGEVAERVLKALLGTKGPPVQSGYFSPDNFTFGTPLYRSQLEKVIQDVAGVRTILQIQFKRRGWFEMRDFSELVYTVSDNEVIRVDNDPLFPERGSLKLEMKGGA